MVFESNKTKEEMNNLFVTWYCLTFNATFVLLLLLIYVFILYNILQTMLCYCLPKSSQDLAYLRKPLLCFLILNFI